MNVHVTDSHINLTDNSSLESRNTDNNRRVISYMNIWLVDMTFANGVTTKLVKK